MTLALRTRTPHEARGTLNVVRRRFELVLDDMTSAVRSFAQTFTVTEVRGNHGQTARLRAQTTRHLTAHWTILCGENSDTPAGRRTAARTR